MDFPQPDQVRPRLPENRKDRSFVRIDEFFHYHRHDLHLCSYLDLVGKLLLLLVDPIFFQKLHVQDLTNV